MDYFDSPCTTASKVIHACLKSASFKRACCLLCRMLRPSDVSECADLVKKMSIVWFGVPPYNLAALKPWDRNLFEHFYKGRIIYHPSGYINLSGKHWGCEFWHSYRKSQFEITSEHYLRSVNLGVFTIDEEMNAKKSVLFGVGIPFEMVAIFTVSQYGIRDLKFQLNYCNLELRIRSRVGTNEIATAYFA